MSNYAPPNEPCLLYSEIVLLSGFEDQPLLDEHGEGFLYEYNDSLDIDWNLVPVYADVCMEPDQIAIEILTFQPIFVYGECYDQF